MKRISFIVIVFLTFLALAFTLSLWSATPDYVDNSALAEPAAVATKDWRKFTLNLLDGRRIAPVAAEYQTVKINKLKSPATVEENVIPAVTKQVTKQVLKTPERIEERVMPAVTQTIEKRVVKTPSRVEKRTVPAKIRTYTSTVPKIGKKIRKSIVESPSTVEYTVIPAVYETVKETVVVSDEHTQLVTIPATYETVTETVTVTPERKETKVIPAEFETAEKKILVQKERLVLYDKDDKILHDFISEQQLEMFLSNPAAPGFELTPEEFKRVTVEVTVQPETIKYIPVAEKYESVTKRISADRPINKRVIPAEFSTKTERVVVQEETTEYSVIPAVYETLQRTIVLEEATANRPAVTETVNVRRLKQPERIVEITVPAKYSQIQKRVLTKPPTIEVVEIPAKFQALTERVLVEPVSVRKIAVPEQKIRIPVAKSAAFFSWSDVSTALPEFNPPKTTLKISIPNRYFANTDGSTPTLQCVYDKLVGALHGKTDLKCPHTVIAPSHKVYQYPNGFVILTKPERINEKAESITDSSGNKINLDDHPIENLGDYVTLLFQKPKNRFRYLAFVVTRRNNAVVGSDASATAVELDETLQEGGIGSDLPVELSQFYFDKGYKCQVWIYEFSKINTQNADLLADRTAIIAKPLLATDAHANGSSALQLIFKSLEQ